MQLNRRTQRKRREDDAGPVELQERRFRQALGRLCSHLCSYLCCLRCLLFNGHYRSVRLLDDEAILACSAYVDLNQIRAGLAPTLEESQLTSVQRRILFESLVPIVAQKRHRTTTPPDAPVRSLAQKTVYVPMIPTCFRCSLQ